MTWTCDLTEARLSDYIDGLLDSAERSAFEAHAVTCTECGPLVASVRSLVGAMHSTEELEEPPRLIYAILDKTLGPRESLSFWQKLVRGLSTPRFAYGTASVFATLLILLSAAGFSFRKPKLADLRPATIYQRADQRVHLIKAQAVRYVSDLRVVYEIQSRLHQDEATLPTTPEQVIPKSEPEKAPGQTDGNKPAQPRQQNRANEIGRQIEMLAAEFPAAFERSAQ